jgi:hypothetical protein
MKTLEGPKQPRPVTVTCKNMRCNAVMEVELAEMRFVSDRDGDAYVMECPHCKMETWVAAGVVNRKAYGEDEI